MGRPRFERPVRFEGEDVLPGVHPPCPAPRDDVPEERIVLVGIVQRHVRLTPLPNRGVEGVPAQAGGAEQIVPERPVRR